jgi:hypothetical protein
MPTTTRALIDSATLHDAFGALTAGSREHWNPWLAKNLIDTTWLLLFDNITLVPGPRKTGTNAVPGYEAKLVSRMPELLQGMPMDSKALASAKQWINHPSKPVRKAWDASKRREEFPEWASYLRQSGWPVHFAANQCLFSSEDSSWLADLLNVSEATLLEAHRQSESEKNVSNWSKGKGGDVAELVGQAYLASILARGKYHEYFARRNELQLIAHPVRDSITTRTNKLRPISAANSESRFVDVLIGSALLEPTANRRIELWIDNISRARLAIRSGAIALPNTVQDSDAEAHAITSARKISIQGAAAWERDLLNWSVGGNISAIGAMLLGPWGIATGLTLVAYKMVRGRTVGESLALAATTDANFRRLGRAVAGKVFR